MSGEYPGSIDMYVDESRTFIDAQPSYAVVIHKTAGFHTAQEVAEFFATTPDMRSTHFVVGQDGTVVQCVRLKDGAGGNCCLEQGYDNFWNMYKNTNLNTVTISIEHVDPSSDNSTDVTPKQKVASFSLVQWILKQKNIPISHVKTHASIDPISRARCPGNYPMDELISFLQGGGMTIPQGWKDDGKTLTAPNGNTVTLGFRDFVLANNWDPEDLPQSGEEWSHQVDMFDPNSGSGSNQWFTYDSLRYTEKDGVTYGPLGHDFIVLRQQRDSLESEVQQLQAQNTALKAGLPQADINSALTSIQQLATDLQALK